MWREARSWAVNWVFRRGAFNLKVSTVPSLPLQQHANSEDSRNVMHFERLTDHPLTFTSTLVSSTNTHTRLYMFQSSKSHVYLVTFSLSSWKKGTSTKSFRHRWWKQHCCKHCVHQFSHALFYHFCIWEWLLVLTQNPHHSKWALCCFLLLCHRCDKNPACSLIWWFQRIYSYLWILRNVLCLIMLFQIGNLHHSYSLLAY